MRQQLLDAIYRDSDKIIAFLRDFVRAKSPNPPGNTLDAVDCIKKCMDEHGLAYELCTLQSDMPNILASKAFAKGDKHLVLNGHIDVFPVTNSTAWKHDPWGAVVEDNKIYGRGTADMKTGTTASLFTYIYLSQLEKELAGRLTLTMVSDEETFGPNGARYLFDAYADSVKGTACLNGEPSSPATIRCGEKGAVWLSMRVMSPGGHSAYPQYSSNSIDYAFEIIKELKTFCARPATVPKEVLELLTLHAADLERVHGKDALRVAKSISMNVGTIKGGPKINMIASECEFEVDFRLPIGVTTQDVVDFVDDIRTRYDFEYKVLLRNEPNWNGDDWELAKLVQSTAKEVTGIEPGFVIGLANTDTRLWRYNNIPAVVYGATPEGVGSIDECVRIEEVLNIIRVHTLAAYEYLKSS
jgi:succinyl-diaminopimelate desuccinylase